MADRRYTEDHEWVEIDGSQATVGISNHAQEQLGDIVFVDLPEADTDLAKGDEVGVIESVKAASEYYAPITGTVVEANEALNDNPALLNSNPEDDGWIFKLTVGEASELDGLMDEAAYKELLSTLD
ncbi:MAG: glycine cleavage system protein GcvH [Pseudomonadota bacterium]